MMNIVVKGKYWLHINMLFLGWIPALIIIRHSNIFHDSSIRNILEVVLYIVLAFIFVVSLLHRLGVLGVDFSVEDRKTLIFKLLKYGAKREKNIWKDKFSETYYETYLKE